MSATIAGALKSYLEGLGLGVAFYRDGPPKIDADKIGANYPYGVIVEGIGYAAERHGDEDDPDRDDGTAELVQVDLWQRARSLPGADGRTTVTERYDLPAEVDGALRSASGLRGYAPFRIYGVTVTGGQRLQPADNVVRHTWTIRIRRSTRRIS